MSAQPRRWTWLLDLITTVTVLIGLTFGAIELRQIKNAQEAQTVLQLFETLRSPEIVRGIGLIKSLPDTTSPETLNAMWEAGTEDWYHMEQVLLAYEGLGVMVFREDVSIEWVDEMFRNSILTAWARFEEQTVQYRAASGNGHISEWLQWLAERLQERDPDAVGPAYEAYRDWEPGS